MKTVFDEEIKIGDEIMYLYMRHGSLLTCFGTVFDIKFKEKPYFPRAQEELHVRKKLEIAGYRENKVCDTKVILTNPTAFKCGIPLECP